MELGLKEILLDQRSDSNGSSRPSEELAQQVYLEVTGDFDEGGASDEGDVSVSGSALVPAPASVIVQATGLAFTSSDVNKNQYLIEIGGEIPFHGLYQKFPNNVSECLTCACYTIFTFFICNSIMAFVRVFDYITTKPHMIFTVDIASISAQVYMTANYCSYRSVLESYRLIIPFMCFFQHFLGTVYACGIDWLATGQSLAYFLGPHTPFWEPVVSPEETSRLKISIMWGVYTSSVLLRWIAPVLSGLGFLFNFGKSQDQVYRNMLLGQLYSISILAAFFVLNELLSRWFIKEMEDTNQFRFDLKSLFGSSSPILSVDSAKSIRLKLWGYEIHGKSEYCPLEGFSDNQIRRWFAACSKTTTAYGILPLYCVVVLATMGGLASVSPSPSWVPGCPSGTSSPNSTASNMSIFNMSGYANDSLQAGYVAAQSNFSVS